MTATPVSRVTIDLPVGRALRRFRRLNGIKQGHVARLLGVSQGSVSRWERVRMCPSPRSAIASSS